MINLYDTLKKNENNSYWNPTFLFTSVWWHYEITCAYNHTRGAKLKTNRGKSDIFFTFCKFRGSITWSTQTIIHEAQKWLARASISLDKTVTWSISNITWRSWSCQSFYLYYKFYIPCVLLINIFKQTHPSDSFV